MKHKISPELKKFYQDILQWLDNGCKYHHLYHTRWALCRSIGQYIVENNLPVELIEEQKKLFAKEHKNCRYPFNKSSESFDDEFMSNSMYKNTARMSFIRKYARD